jgi:hypothetical protein
MIRPPALKILTLFFQDVGLKIPDACRIKSFSKRGAGNGTSVINRSNLVLATGTTAFGHSPLRSQSIYK